MSEKPVKKNGKNLLRQKIAEKIKAEGPMTFERFMAMALYEPALGYYASPETEIGKAGDFYTSPHLHPVFGRMLARQIEEMREFMGGGEGGGGEAEEFAVVETGPGRGYLAKDILDYLKGREIYKTLHYHLVELNPSLAAAQKTLLAGHEEKLLWHGSLSELKGIRGVVLANELIDSLPVRLVEMRDDGLKEVYITLGQEEDGQSSFAETLRPVEDEALLEYFREFAPEGFFLSAEGYRTEANLALRGWLREVSGALAEGFVVNIDYGYPAWDYYGPERDRGTLLCYKGHRVNENPYENVGLQDITAHVNFSALKKWGDELGLSCVGFARQGTYLVSAGIDELLAGLDPFDIIKAKGLLLPGTMGETHKVMIQYKGKGEKPSLRGFAIRNQMNSL